ncbi:hypothetical protein [Dinoroseobacter shibae]|jgi:hypothetical protein|nr:hypothetical protein [Dinoroseobacter shibae]URF46824.1 hypothetical protein M8008_00500 [Dinoroseobacter shibae]URF51135.1 hypothetical protein M8007_00500 [Dinoroseobacter shibae]
MTDIDLTEWESFHLRAHRAKAVADAAAEVEYTLGEFAGALKLLKLMVTDMDTHDPGTLIFLLDLLSNYAERRAATEGAVLSEVASYMRSTMRNP